MTPPSRACHNRHMNTAAAQTAGQTILANADTETIRGAIARQLAQPELNDTEARVLKWNLAELMRREPGFAESLAELLAAR